MSTQVDGIKTFTAGAALEANRRVKLASGVLQYAGDEEAYIGVTLNKYASGDQAAVKLKTTGATFLMTASAAITSGASAYGAANGKIEPTGTAAQVTALEAATADGDIIEVLPL